MNASVSSWNSGDAGNARSSWRRWTSLALGATLGVVVGVSIVTAAPNAASGADAPSTPKASTLAGRWDATITLEGVVIPFRLDLAGDGAQLVGTLFNGDRPQTTTSARVDQGQIVLQFEHYLTKITASPQDGALVGKIEGRFDREKYIASYPFQATRYVASTAAAPANVPKIDGLWLIPNETAKGEKAWRFIVEQKGADLSAAILRVDGDTGSLTGTYKDGGWVLSHFDGSRPLVLRVTPAADGTLQLEQNGAFSRRGPLTAYRPDVARAKGLPEPANFTTHTTLRDPNERFTFSFPDVKGNTVSSSDPKFKDKVIVAIVTGTWCPNCHDEAQYLVQLYDKYRAKGLEIVALDFEEPEQQDELTRVQAFVKKYGVEYTYLIAGAPVEMWEKVPQAVNLNTWPATFFVGRDGRVRRIHAGFAAPASGAFHQELQREFTSTIEALLAEPVRPKLESSSAAAR